MAKVYGNIRNNEKKANERQPDLTGNIRIGGYTGQRAEEKNREAATFLRNVAKEFADKKQTYISIAAWKKIDPETDKPYLSICVQDNSWSSNNGGHDGGGSKPRSAENSAPEKSGGSSEDSLGDIPF
jgi:hypothetical protein